MKILYFTHERKMGGASKSLVVLARLMKEKGHDVIVVVPQKNTEIDNELRKNEIVTISCFYVWWQYSKNFSVLKKFIYRCLYFFNRRAVSKIVKKCKNLNIDLVHTNTSVLDIGAQVAEKLNKKHIWHFREFGDADLELEYIKGKRMSMKYVQSHANKVIFISQNIKEYFKDYFNENQSILIYNGISNEFLYKKEVSEIDKECIKFLISGALQPNKGQDLSIQAAHFLMQKGYNNYKIYIAGRNINNYEETLKKMIIDYNVEDKVEILGFVNDMKKLRKEVDIELVCSNREAFGRVTVEAMMGSNPVIGSNSGANPELITDYNNGILFQNNDSRDLMNKMLYFLDKPKQVFIMGENAYKSVSNKFTAEKNADKIEQLYIDILNIK